MKKNISILMLTLLAGGMFTACTNEDEPVVPDASESKNLSVEAVLSPLNGDKTKSPISDWTSGDQLGLYIKAAGLNGADYGRVNGTVVATFGSSDWELNPEVELSSTPANIFAYYPYNAAASNPQAVPVDIDAQTDYLFGGAAATASSASPKVSLSMKHALCIFSFNVKTNGYIGDGKLTAVKMRNKTGKNVFGKTGTMDISTGVITTTSYGEYAIATDKVIADGWSTELPMAMVFPMTVSNTPEVEFVFTIDGKEYVVNVPSREYAKGQKYIFNLTINSATMELDSSNIHIIPWGSETSVNLEDVMTKVKGFAYALTTTASNEVHALASLGNLAGSVDWGDGSSENYAQGLQHTYAQPGTYNVLVSSEEEVQGVTFSSIAKLQEIDFSQI